MGALRVPLVGLVLVCLVATVLAKSAITRRQPVGGWKAFRADCEKRSCRHLPPVEDEDCILRCQGGPCYELVYGQAPLEPGELDPARSTQYQRCLGELELQLRPGKLWPPKIDGSTGQLLLPPRDKIDMDVLQAAVNRNAGPPRPKPSTGS